MALSLVIAIAAATFGVGVVVGMVLDRYTDGRYIRKYNEELVQHILTMRKQGFVPQFEITQHREIDLAEDIREF